MEPVLTGRSRRQRRTAPSLQLTERDRAILSFIADHRLVLGSHAAALAGCSARVASARLSSLTRAGLLERRTLFHRQAACYQVTRAGLAAVGSSLPRPRLDLQCYMHDVGCAWLWLNARGGAFGPAAEVLSERRLRSRDARREGGAAPLAVRLGGYGPAGREQLHYPDLLVRTLQGHRIAIELELTAKGERRRERILTGYGSDARIDAAVYLVNKPALARSLRSTAASLGITSFVHVQTFAWSSSMTTLERHLAGGEVAHGRGVASTERAERGAAELGRTGPGADCR